MDHKTISDAPIAPRYGASGKEERSIRENNIRRMIGVRQMTGEGIYRATTPSQRDCGALRQEE